MNSGDRWPGVWLAVLLSGTLATAARSEEQPRQVELRGQVVCLAEEMHKRHQSDLPKGHEHIWGFKTADGACYTLLRTPLSVALFLDERLREKQLLLKGLVLPQTQILDVWTIRSIRDGVVHEIYYYCEVCAIKAVTPEVCMCCREPVELVEKPLSKAE